MLTTVKLVLIALNIIPNRMKYKKIMFFIYMGTMVTHGKDTSNGEKFMFDFIDESQYCDSEDSRFSDGKNDSSN